jgi:hypothetical protein
MASVNQSADPMQSSQIQPKEARQTSHRSNRATGGIILLALFGVYWVYGWAGEIRNASTPNYPTTGLTTTPRAQTILGGLFIVDAIFVVIGFGLLLAYFKRATVMAIATSISVVSATVILSPIFQKFWFNVFITNFRGSTITTADPTRMYQYSLGGLWVYLDYYNLRIALANAIAQLVVILGVFGRLNATQLVFHSILFNFAWNLNHFLNVLLVRNSPDLRFFDDYQISNVYLFAATYGIVLSFFVRSPPTAETSDFSSTANSSILAHIGTFFLFLAFCATTTMFSAKYTFVNVDFARLYLWQEAFISIFIALSASVIFTYAFSVLLNPKAKLGIRASLLGTITGAIMWGSVAGTSKNIGAAIAVGLIAGLISALFYEKLYPSLNNNKITDSFGIVNIWIVAFLGTFVVSPLVLRTYYNNDVDLPTLYPSNAPSTGFSTSFFINNKNVAGWSLIYVGISLAVALVAGLIVGLLMKFFERTTTRYYEDNEFFKSASYGLREPIQAPHQDRPIGSAQQFITR